MHKISCGNYRGFTRVIDTERCGAVYPLSVVQGFQSGEIYTHSSSILIRHYCGFAFMYGEQDSNFLEAVYDLMSESKALGRRFVLFAESSAADFFRSKNDAVIAKRFFFTFGGRLPVEKALSRGFSVCETDEKLVSKLNGRITPAFSWDDNKRFLERGMGFYVTHENEPAAWAFSAAISADEIDIGAETLSEYRGKGLGYIAAREMIRHCLDIEKSLYGHAIAKTRLLLRLHKSLAFQRPQNALQLFCNRKSLHFSGEYATIIISLQGGRKYGKRKRNQNIHRRGQRRQ